MRNTILLCISNTL